MNILSIFITSNRVNLLLNKKGVYLSESFNYYPFFQSIEDLEFLIINYLRSLNLNLEDTIIIPISTIFDLKILGKKVNFLNIELKKQSDFLYIYLDNLTFYSYKNISLTSLGLSKRSDNFISNRSVFSANKFTGDIEEVVLLSKSINDTFQSSIRKVVLGGDYFSNKEIPNEFKLNLVSEILSQGFYEIYLDTKGEYPNFLNLRYNSSIPLKFPEFEKFSYLLTSDKPTEFLFEKVNSQKFLNLKLNETFFLHFNDEKDLKLKYKGKNLGNETVLLDTDFSGLFIDLRSTLDKKKLLGIESFRKVLKSIEKENDYSSL